MLTEKNIQAVIMLAGEKPSIWELRNLRQLQETTSDLLLVAADGGGEYYREIGLVPDMIIGDSDSGGVPEKIFPQVPHIDYPTAKNLTDGEAAFLWTAEHCDGKILVLGAFGGRTDHFFANLFLPRLWGKNADRFIFFHKEEIIYYCKDTLFIEGKKGDRMSLLALEKTKGINLKGFLYPLSNYTLLPGSTRGISNELKQRKGEISIQEGMLMVIHHFCREEICYE